MKNKTLRKLIALENIFISHYMGEARSLAKIRSATIDLDVADGQWWELMTIQQGAHGNRRWRIVECGRFMNVTDYSKVQFTTIKQAKEWALDNANESVILSDLYDIH